MVGVLVGAVGDVVLCRGAVVGSLGDSGVNAVPKGAVVGGSAGHALLAQGSEVLA
ncbi:unannotated protein [freshwater metagenome]|uniref:Unannotated protein n=1 Tax=freshwater metagenome TaxID=449393 RepID=A0A6J6D3K2_9ZZZZ